MGADLDHARLTGVLEKLHLGVNASDLHGSLMGCLCAGAPVDEGDWLDALQLDPGDEVVARNESLQRLYRSCRSQVDDLPARIAPLLPARTAPLAARAAALVDWCRGFLGGFGLGGANRYAALPEDATEILHDLGVIAASHFDVGEQTDDAQALADVIDFVGTACSLLLREARSRQRSRGLH